MLLCLSCSITRSSLWKPTLQVRTSRPFQGGRCFGCECSELTNQSKGSLLPSIFAGMIKRGKFFFFLLLPLTREAVVSLDLIGTLLMDANGWTSSWQSPARAGTAGAAYSYQLFTLGCGSAWGQAKGSNPIFACWRFLPLRIALRNIIDRKKKTLNFCIVVVILGTWLEVIWERKD